MDPSCGKCLGSDCGGFPGYTNPDCPKHGTVAQATRQAALDLAVKELSGKSLRNLVRPARKELESRLTQHVQRFRQPLDRSVPETIRRLSEQIVEAARAGRRRKKLFTVHGSMHAEPEASLHETQRIVYAHFKARIRIVFREVWRDYSDHEYEAWAVW